MAAAEVDHLVAHRQRLLGAALEEQGQLAADPSQPPVFGALVHAVEVPLSRGQPTAGDGDVSAWEVLEGERQGDASGAAVVVHLAVHGVGAFAGPVGVVEVAAGPTGIAQSLERLSLESELVVEPREQLERSRPVASPERLRPSL